MQRYPVRPTHRKGLTAEALRPVLERHFEQVRVEGTAVLGSFGAVKSIKVWGENKELAVDVAMDPKVPAEIAQETIRKYNTFLEEATGYSAKERAKRLRKSAGAPEKGT